MTLDSRLRGNDGSRSRCAGGTGLDSRLRDLPKMFPWSTGRFIGVSSEVHPR